MTQLALQMPGDFCLTYEWRSGSVPLPYHFEFEVIIGPGLQGRVDFHPDYPSSSTPTWTEPFALTADQLLALYRIVIDKKLDRKSWRTLPNPPIGGSVEYAQIVLNGQTFSIPPHPTPTGSKAALALYTFIRESLVPQALWDKLTAQRDHYRDAHERGPGGRGR